MLLCGFVLAPYAVKSKKQGLQRIVDVFEFRGDSRVTAPKVTDIYDFFFKTIVNIGLKFFGM